MRSTTSIEANLVKFFAQAPLATANVVFGIIRSTIKDRNAAASAPSAPPKATRKAKATRRKRAAASTVAPAVNAPITLPEVPASVV